MFNKVLVLADGDDPKQPALRRALECVADGGEIVVLAVVYEPMLEGYLGNKAVYEPLRRRVLNERLERAAALARAVESQGVRGAAKAVWSHPMHQAIAAEVEKAGIDLVVAGSGNLHQSGGGPGPGLSHSDWQVVTNCPCPVLIVKSDGQKPYRTVVAAVDPFHSHAKPAELDRELLRCAKALQSRTGAALEALHCYLPVEYFGADLTALPPWDPNVGDSRLAAVHALCDEVGVARGAARVVPGVPHKVLGDLQGRGEADVIVMGALARGRLAEFLIGSTAERILHYGTGDVLVVTPSRRKA